MQPRKKSGVPLKEAFESPLYLRSLTPLCCHINQNAPKSNPTNEEALAMIVFKFISLMDKLLGKHVLPKQPMTKLPLRTFENMEVNGTVHHILRIVLSKPASYLDILLEGRTNKSIEEGLSFLQEIHKVLESNGFLPQPKIFIGATVPSTIVSELKVIATRHKAEIVKYDRLATHIIEWDDEVDNLPAELPEEFLRPVEFNYQDGLAKVHWWYHPDSFDESIPSNEVDDPSDVPDMHYQPPQWRVCCRFLRDLELFNEWYHIPSVYSLVCV